MIELRGRHLLGALGLAAAAHIGAIVFVVSKPPNAGAIAVGDGGLLVSASLAGGGVVSEEAVIDDVALEPPEELNDVPAHEAASLAPLVGLARAYASDSAFDLLKRPARRAMPRGRRLLYLSAGAAAVLEIGRAHV